MGKKGFTLLELIIVIIIIGVLATLGISQYTRMIERARGAEARAIIGAIRSNAAAIYMQNNNDCTTCNNVNLGIGTDYPGPAAGNCATTHYFSYRVTAAAVGITVTATRCLAGGKTPNVTGTAGWITLTNNFGTGADVWTTSGAY